MNWSLRHIYQGSPWLAAITLMLLLTTAGCSKVPKPTSDTTPPTSRWNVLNLDNNASEDISGNGSIAAHSGDHYRVFFFAEDPQGIHKISLASTIFWQCASGSIIQNHGPSLGIPDTKTLQPDSQGYVLTSTFLLQDANLSAFDCQAGYAFVGGTVTYTGAGENYFNGTIQAKLVLNVSP